MSVESKSLEQLVSLLVPLLFLVLLEFCSVARDIDLRKESGGESWFLADIIETPGFGLLTIIHGFNYGMLLFLFGWFINRYQGNLFLALAGRFESVYFLLGVFTVAIWIILPFLEVKEYQNMSVVAEEYPFPDSVIFHIALVSINMLIMSLLLWLRKLHSGPENGGIVTIVMGSFESFTSQSIVSILVLGLGLLLPFSSVFGIVGFTGLLQEEILGKSHQRQLDEF